MVSSDLGASDGIDMSRSSAEIIAAKSKSALAAIGEISPIGHRSIESTFQFKPYDGTPLQIWVHRSYGSYSAAWQSVFELPDDHQVDHVYPKSWAAIKGMKVAWIRVFPVASDVNTGAGRSWEKLWAGFYRRNPPPNGVPDIIYAEHYQILKILSEDVGKKGAYTSSQNMLRHPAQTVTGRTIQARLSRDA